MIEPRRASAAELAAIAADTCDSEGCTIGKCREMRTLLAHIAALDVAAAEREHDLCAAVAEIAALHGEVGRLRGDE